MKWDIVVDFRGTYRDVYSPQKREEGEEKILSPAQ